MTDFSFIDKAFELLPPKLDTRKARVLMGAIGYQESRFEYRRQMNEGPAMGFWQFERMGGVNGVLRHPVSKLQAALVCEILKVKPTPMPVWRALEHDDVLAAVFARLLLWTDPKPLPEIGELGASWAYYLHNWRPGKPHPKTWAEMYAKALKEF